ncbi:acyl-CoA dehydrogenase NM domain-like protein [Aspergillus germanicus]
MPSDATKSQEGGDYWSQPPASLDLAQLPVVSSNQAISNPLETIKTHYQQAKAICQAHGLTVEDILTMSPKFWKLHADPINVRMGAAITLIGSQYNLVVGTIAPYVKRRPDLVPLLHRLMDFCVSGIYMLTELGHGLDARNLQTVATMLPGGGFDLHTPTRDAAKCMPVSTPISGIEKIAIVFARLVIAGKGHGVRAFIVRLNDGRQMMPGITAKLLPYRAGSSYLDHAITTFNHVQLSASALLGSVPTESATDQDNFSTLIWRVPVGTLSLSLTSLPVLKTSAWIAAQYAMKRTVGTDATSIIHFRTQQIPIFHAIAQAYVVPEFAKWSIARFMDSAADPRLRHAYAILFKTVAMEHMLTSTRILSQEIGWRGLFEDNQLIRMELESRGIKIAEGDVSVLCIRLTSDILHRKITIPPPADQSSLLARHEAALLSEMRLLFVKECANDFRSPAANRHVLPRCQALVEAIGQRMAYEAAADSEKAEPALSRIYEIGAVKSDLACYVEQGFIGRKEVADAEDECIEELVPRLGELLEGMDISAYCKTPILSEDLWEDFLDRLDTFDSSGLVDSQ